ncbi:MAG: hypothetical protein RL095_1675 [Verrucomicrobiota bacterium]|jgi:DNA polymerase-1
MKPRLFLIDSMAYIFRAFYAIPSNMHAQDGTPSNAAFGFIKAIEKILKDFKPTHIAAVMDTGSKTFRNEMYPEYKANRKECPEDLKPQFELIQTYLKLRGIPVISLANYEADDVIGTLAKRATASGMESVICTGDKDLMQLVDDSTFICQTHKENLWVDAPMVKELMGVRPDQIIDFLAITGDSSDNVPGLPGLGEKSAIALLEQFGTLEEMLAHPEQITKKKQQETVREKADLARLSKTLVSLSNDLPLPLTPAELVPGEADFDALRTWYGSMNFRAILNDLDKMLARQGTFDFAAPAKAGAPRPVLAPLPEAIAAAANCLLRIDAFAASPHQHELLHLEVLLDGVARDLLDGDEKLSGLERLKAKRGLLKDKTVTLENASKHLDFPGLCAAWLTQAPELPAEQLELFDKMEFDALLKLRISDISSETVDYRIVRSRDELDALIAAIRAKGGACFDTETTGLRPFECSLVGLGFAMTPGQAFYVPLPNAKARVVEMDLFSSLAPQEEGFAFQLSREEILAAVKPVFADPALAFCGQNVKYDLEVLISHGIRVAKVDFDTLVASQVLHPSRFAHDLDSQALFAFNYRKIATDELLKSGRKTLTMDQVPVEQVARYCCEDVDFALRLRREHEAELERQNLSQLYRELELPLIPILTAMEEKGILLDPLALRELGVTFQTEIAEVEKRIHELAGEAFNVGSPKQVSEVLFGKMGLKGGKKTSTGWSTDASVLETLAEEHEIAKQLLRHRSLSKLKGTYVDSLPGELNPKDGRVHTSFSQAGAATGRLSSSNPNLQNIPTRSKEGKLIRSAFIAAPGCVFLSCDYSQIELRLMAELAQDPGLLEAFASGQDVHTRTAALVFGVEPDAVTKEQRYAAKAVNFGIIYGQGAYGLAKEIGVTPVEAKKFISAYFKRYPKVQSYMQQAAADASRDGYSKTLFGRRRSIPELRHSSAALRNAAERIAVNSPIQGSAADLIKLAMIAVDRELKVRGLASRLLLQIHDELLFEVPEAELDLMKEIIPPLMATAAPQLKVPIKVDTALGKRWSDCD